jgi:uncharacterized ferritin-like protein (DUF455 family)
MAPSDATTTVEQACLDYLSTRSLEEKLAGPAESDRWEEAPVVRRLDAPARPAELVVATSGPKRRYSARALANPERRAELVHTFLHHELQAAELMCWAICAFADAPRAFRRGLLGICRDEVRHAQLYRRHLQQLGCDFGHYPVRDWFWERVPFCATPLEFVATLGVGLEGGNLDHMRRFAERLAAAGDARAAAICEQVGREEIAHVRFALAWFRRFSGADDFATWARSLPPPLSPLLMRGLPLNEEDRLSAGMSPAFVAALAAWDPR